MLKFGRNTLRLHGIRSLSLSSVNYKPSEFSNSSSNEKNRLKLDARLFSDVSRKQQGDTIYKHENKKEEWNRFANIYSKTSEALGRRNLREGSSKDGHKKGRRNDANHERSRHFSDGRLHQKTKLRFNITTGSDQAQNALRSLISKIHGFRNSYNVKFVDPTLNRMEIKHLASIVNLLDLSKNGIYVVPPAKEKDFPIVKVNAVYEMIKSYSDALALERERELLQKGSVIAQKVIRLRDRAEKKKSATKVLTLSWRISLSDLENQKLAEIQKKLKKGEKFLIYIGEKNSLYSARKNADKEGGIIDSTKNNVLELDEQTFEDMDQDVVFELKRRQMIVQKIQEYLQSEKATAEVTGELESRIIISCTSNIKPSESSKEEADVCSKEHKRQRMLMKQKQREEEAKQKMLKDEDELDSLYLFKIEN